MDTFSGTAGSLLTFSDKMPLSMSSTSTDLAVLIARTFRKCISLYIALGTPCPDVLGTRQHQKSAKITACEPKRMPAFEGFDKAPIAESSGDCFKAVGGLH